MLPNSVLNVFCRVSVSTNVPEMNVTPSTIASAVSASRSLWAKSPRRVTWRISCPHHPHPLKDRIRGRLPQFAYYGPVGEEDDPVRVRGATRVVRHHHDRLPKFPHRPLEE